MELQQGQQEGEAASSQGPEEDGSGKDKEINLTMMEEDEETRRRKQEAEEEEGNHAGGGPETESASDVNGSGGGVGVGPESDSMNTDAKGASDNQREKDDGSKGQPPWMGPRNTLEADAEFERQTEQASKVSTAESSDHVPPQIGLCY